MQALPRVLCLCGHTNGFNPRARQVWRQFSKNIHRVPRAPEFLASRRADGVSVNRFHATPFQMIMETPSDLHRVLRSRARFGVRGRQHVQRHAHELLELLPFLFRLRAVPHRRVHAGRNIWSRWIFLVMCKEMKSSFEFC